MCKLYLFNYFIYKNGIYKYHRSTLMVLSGGFLGGCNGLALLCRSLLATFCAETIQFLWVIIDAIHYFFLFKEKKLAAVKIVHGNVGLEIPEKLDSTKIPAWYKRTLTIHSSKDKCQIDDGRVEGKFDLLFISKVCKLCKHHIDATSEAIVRKEVCVPVLIKKI